MPEVDQPDGDPAAWLIDLEITLVEKYGWSLHDIDDTDASSILSYLYRRIEAETKPKRRRVYCDQVPL